MKYIYILLALLSVGLTGCTTTPTRPETPKIKTEYIRDNAESMRRSLKIEASPYDGARIENVYLERRRQKNKKGIEKDFLYVHGSIKNTSISRVVISGIVVVAEFTDEEGNVIASATTEIAPLIIRQNGARKGSFIIKTAYDPAMVQCNLKLLRPEIDE